MNEKITYGKDVKSFIIDRIKGELYYSSWVKTLKIEMQLI